jgi:hypothetical protein
MTMSSVRGRERDARRWRRWAALALVAAVVVPVTVLAVRAPGFHAAKVNLNDGGVWVTNGDRGLIGRINSQIGRLEVAVAAPGDFDIVQTDDTLAVDLATSHEMTTVDVSLAQLGRPVKVPDSATSSVGGHTAALSDAASGKVWVTERTRAGQLDTAAAPTVEAGPRTKTVVGVDGTAYSYAEGALDVLAVTPAGQPRRIPVPFGLRDVELGAVGDQPVVLEPASGRLVLPGGRVAELGRDRRPRIQQAGPAHDDVLVATDDALLAVSLAEGAVRTLTAAGTGGAVAPVWLDVAGVAGSGEGCAFAAWTSRPTWAQVCPARSGSPARAERVGTIRSRPGAALRFRVNRHRVVLNDSRSGLSLLFTDDDPIEIDNWREVLPDDEGPQPEERIIQKPQESCDPGRVDAELNADEAGTRAGRPVIVPVLDNDRFPSCQVPVVTVPDPPRPEAAAVAVVRDGTAVQVTPAPGRRDPVTFSYAVSLGSRTLTAALRVNVVDPARNSPPRPANDTTTVVAGRTVRHDVLANDVDPEGDALSVVDVRLAGEGAFTFRTDGEVSYTAPGGITGEQTITYTAADEYGATATGLLKVVVTGEGVNVAPTARNDRVEVVVGRRQPVPVLANDSDPNGDPLTISEVAGVAGDLDVRREGTTGLSVAAARAGTYTFTYTVSDGEAQARAYVRVDARPTGDNRPPVAVRDDLAARPGVPAFADLVANDIDPDGDLLAVVAVTSPDPALSVALLDMHIVRVTAPAGFSDSVDVRYTVSDGRAAAEGVLVVRPHDIARVDQAPVVADDEVSVRAGNVIAVRVLDNDADPEGERLSLVRVDELVDEVSAERGRVFVEGDQLRYQAPAAGAATVRFAYTVADPGGNRADGRVTVRVLPAEQANRPPAGPLLEARAFAGSEVTIPVALGGLDPDGDVVTVVGLSDRDGEQPTRGHAQVVPGGIRYRADRGAAGTDAFAFVLRDSGGLEATGQVRVAVVPRPTTNSPPVAAPDRVTARVGTSVPVPVLANDSDPDGDPLTLLVEGKDAPTQPRGARVTPAPDGGTLVVAVEPAAPAGDVSFSYAVADGRGGSTRGIVTVSISVNEPLDQPPVARDDVVETQAPGAVVDVDVLANDRDPDGPTNRLTVAVEPPVGGFGPGVDAQVQPDGRIRVHVGDRGTAFVYSITDGGGGTARAVVSVPVLADRPPACEIGSAEVRAGDEIAVDVLALCRDPEGAPLTLARLLSGARGGTARLDGDRVVFRAAPEVPGDAGFDAVVTDGSATAVVGVVVRVTGRNWPPALAATRIELPAGAERLVDLGTLVTDLNAEDHHTFSNLRGATPAITATLTGTVLAVRAADNARGATALLSVTVSDGANEVTGQLEVVVLRHDGQPPAAVDDAGRTHQEQPVTIDVVANDIDPVGKGLTIIDVSTTHGTAAIAGPAITFTPLPGFFGEALITYRIVDASRDPDRSSAATVRVSVIGRPSRPPAPAGTPESHQVRLTWGAAQPNGAPVDYYAVETDTGLTRQSASTSLVFDGLVNGQPYRFRVAAHNEAVERPDLLAFSDWSAPVTPDAKPGTPAPPTLRFGNGAVTVSWAPPPNDGTPIRNYQLRVGGGGARDVGLVTTYVWGGLKNGTKYDFSVRAENGAGFGEWSSPTDDAVNGIPAAAPGAVPGVTAARLDRDVAVGGSVQVSWGTPADNGDPNFTFVVGVSPADAPDVTIRDPAARSTVIGGLVNGRRYTFTVTASNKAGPGPPGQSSAVPAARPGVMGAPAAVAGDHSVTLTATAPADNGAAIARIEAQVSGTGAWQPVTGPVAAGQPVTATVNGLTNGTTYTVSLRACNEVGCGPAGPASGAVRPFGPPATPNVTAAVNGATITWTWNAVDGNGRNVIRYDLVLDGQGIPAATGTAYTRDFFDRGGHTLSVVAVNEEGARSQAGVRSATADPPPVAVTTTGGVAKLTWDSYLGPTGPHPGEVPADTTVRAACRVSSGGSTWLQLPDYSNHWIRASDVTGSDNPQLPPC